MEKTFADVLDTLVSSGKAFRAMEREVFAATKEKISAQHLINLHTGMSEPSYKDVEKLARTYPDMAVDFYISAGFPVPFDLLADDMARGMPGPGDQCAVPLAFAHVHDKIRELVSKTGDPPHEVVRKAIERYGAGLV